MSPIIPKIPVTVCLMTTTKGHFGVKDRYAQTLKSFGEHLPFSEFEECIANIRISDNDHDFANNVMTPEIQRHGFRVETTEGEWKHHTESHQTNYIMDCITTVTKIKTPYVLMVEDDWRLNVKTGSWINWIHRAVSYFEEYPGLVQIRIPRFDNELERINGLKAKHNLDKWATPIDDHHFRHNDFSMNPSFYRTRDLRAALIMTLVTGVPKHIEHGLGVTLGVLGSKEPFACFNPKHINIGHTGTLVNEEDDISKPIIAK